MEAVAWALHEQSVAHKYGLSGALFVEIIFLPFKRSRSRVRAEIISILLLFPLPEKNLKPTVSCPTAINDPESYIKLLSVVIDHFNKIVVSQRNDKTWYQDIAGYNYWGISETWFILFFMGQIQSLDSDFCSEVNRMFCLRLTKIFISV